MGFIGIRHILFRGVVLKGLFDQRHLDDPNVAARFKYFVVLNGSCPADPTHIVFITSKVGKFSAQPHLKADLFHLRQEDYKDWLTQQSCINFADIHSISLDELQQMIDRKLLTIVGELTKIDLDACEKVIETSKQIEPRIRRLIRTR